MPSCMRHEFGVSLPALLREGPAGYVPRTLARTPTPGTPYKTSSPDPGVVPAAPAGRKMKGEDDLALYHSRAPLPQGGAWSYGKEPNA